jgi:perosamine synthetase
MSSDILIPVYQPFLEGNERRYVGECIESSWISSKGPYVQKFEQAFADFIGVKYATSVCNGTVALHLALVSLGIGPGDEVIVPTLTYIASVNAITYTGALPVFVDSREDSWQLDPEDVKKKISTKTRAILPVHLYGHPCPMDELTEISQRHDLFIVEDCAEAIGAIYRGRRVGAFGHISAFSFYGNKTITTGEGGMVATNDETLFERAFHFKGQGLAKFREYWHDTIGYNYRMTNICCALGLAQLEQVDEILSRKKRIRDWYCKYLADLPLAFHGVVGDVEHSYWMVSIVVESPRDREELRDYLKACGIETRPVFYPVHTMPMYSTKFQRHPVAEKIGWRGINLPSWPGLTEAQVLWISECIHRYYEKEKQ